MDYNHIKNYLDKFKNILSLKEEKDSLVVGVIEHVLKIKILSKDIQIKPPFIYIKASPLVRNEILMNKEIILKEILALSSGSNFKDIR